MRFCAIRLPSEMRMDKNVPFDQTNNARGDSLDSRVPFK